MKTLILFLFFISPAFAAQKVTYTPSKKECFSAGAAIPWKYCVHTPAEGGVNGNIAYLLHGRGLDENTWNDDTFYTAMIQKYWAEKKLTPPTVVTVSFGPFWLLTAKGKAAQSGLMNYFVEAVIPEVESRVGEPKERIIFGESMGGLNSLEVGLVHGALFSRVAALCPALYKDSPFVSPERVQEFIDRTGANPEIIAGVMLLLKNFITDEAEWNSYSPVKLIETAKPGPKLYMSTGLYDAYGNYEGSELFAEAAKSRGFTIEWRPQYGGHCATDVSSVAEFLAK